MSRTVRLGFILTLLAIAAAPSSAQLSGTSVSEDAGPVSESGRSVSEGSRPVHETGRSTHESSAGALSGNSVRESSVGTMKSGAVSEISAGTVTSSRSLRREKTTRLAPAPPRIVWEHTVDAPVEWQPVSNFDGLIDDINAIQPLERELETDLDEDFANQQPATDSQQLD